MGGVGATSEDLVGDGVEEGDHGGKGVLHDDGTVDLGSVVASDVVAVVDDLVHTSLGALALGALATLELVGNVGGVGVLVEGVSGVGGPGSLVVEVLVVGGDAELDAGELVVVLG